MGPRFSAQFLGVAVGGGLALSGVGPAAVPLVGGAVAPAAALSVRQVTPVAEGALPADGPGLPDADAPRVRRRSPAG
ncbi:hypothetical protein [Streptacidiphilus sp. P02-A3a]|uniref:hypothetical protein n=1 Tax=Streptacidiphilus sp. P02-A3a TaxID=2704468 RepID=UPI0015FD0C4D|nr:hypothetical protein [Streptacidiphilus sp. P02-A3a]QMU71362.1 hypothetical protein GXP74_27145 [Streptacidiphilus sp. P02-A3a]